MSEQEYRAAYIYADLKKLIIGKTIRSVEYGLSNLRAVIQIRTDISEEVKIKMVGAVTVAEQEMKDELKKMEV